MLLLILFYLLVFWIFFTYCIKISYLIENRISTTNTIISLCKEFCHYFIKCINYSYYDKVGISIIISICKCFFIFSFIFAYIIYNQSSCVFNWGWLVLYLLINVAYFYVKVKTKNKSYFVLFLMFICNFLFSFVSNTIFLKIILFHHQLISKITIRSFFYAFNTYSTPFYYDTWFSNYGFILSYVINYLLLFLISKILDKLIVLFFYLYLTTYISLGTLNKDCLSYWLRWVNLYNLYTYHLEIKNNVNAVFFSLISGSILLFCFIYFYLFISMFPYIVVFSYSLSNSIDTFCWFLVDNSIFPFFIFCNSTNLLFSFLFMFLYIFIWYAVLYVISIRNNNSASIIFCLKYNYFWFFIALSLFHFILLFFYISYYITV